MRALFTQPPEKQHKGVHTQSLYLTMRDGTLIAVDVLLPTGYDPPARLPVVLTMTRYWRSFELRMPGPRNRAPIAPRESLADDLVMRGFAMVIVDARGSGASTGVSRHPWTPEEIADYGEVAVWAVAQPWCSGKVGAVGISYEGTTAQLVAATGVEAVKAVVPQQVEFDLYTDVAFPGGILNEAFVKAWSEGNELLDSNKVPKWFPLPWFASSATLKSPSSARGATKRTRMAARTQSQGPRPTPIRRSSGRQLRNSSSRRSSMRSLPETSLPSSRTYVASCALMQAMVHSASVGPIRIWE